MSGNLHVYNAQIWTGLPERPWARRLTIQSGRIDELDRMDGSGFPGLDAAGCTVVPGLIDAHMHLLMGGLSLGQLDLSAVRSRREFELAIACRHAALAPRQWLIGRGWSGENWGGELPEHSWLAAAEQRPAVCWRMDQHAVLVNQAVLGLVEVPEEVDGGRIVRDVTGRPTGLLIEAAAWRLVIPAVPVPDLSQKLAAFQAARQHAVRLGLTAVGSMEYARDVEEVFAPLRDGLTPRCRVILLDRALDDEPLDFGFARSFRADERLAISGCKTFIDGTLGSRSARMLAEYADDPGNRGLLVELARLGRLGEWAAAVAKLGLSPTMHAIGDEAARLALNAIEDLDPACRPRIEHAQQIDPADIARFAGIIASMQPLHKADDGCYVHRRLGDDRLAGTFAFRSLSDAGARLAFGSDWPVVSCDPMLGIRAAVTGLTFDGNTFAPEQNLSVQEALAAYTSGAAHALRMDDAGRLAPGFVGDFTLLDRDPFDADWAASPPRVLLTVVGGRIAYDGRGTRASELNPWPSG